MNRDDLAQKIIEFAHGHNNTNAWRNKDSVFIDSLKHPELFLNGIKENFGIEGKILHQEKERQEVLFEIEATGLPFGGRETICHVIEIPL